MPAEQCPAAPALCCVACSKRECSCKGRKGPQGVVLMWCKRIVQAHGVQAHRASSCSASASCKLMQRKRIVQARAAQAHCARLCGANTLCTLVRRKLAWSVCSRLLRSHRQASGVAALPSGGREPCHTPAMEGLHPSCRAPGVAALRCAGEARKPCFGPAAAASPYDRTVVFRVAL